MCCGTATDRQLIYTRQQAETPNANVAQDTATRESEKKSKQSYSTYMFPATANLNFRRFPRQTQFDALESGGAPYIPATFCERARGSLRAAGLYASALTLRGAPLPLR